MDFFSRAFYVEPSLVGYIGAGLMHSALWMAIGSHEWGAIKHFKNWMLSRYAYVYKGAITENLQDDEKFVEMYGMKEDPGALWLGNVFTLLHHGVGGLFMLVGVVMGKPWIWRHGLLTEIFGMDILDFVRVIWCKLFPPGPFPMCNSHSNPQLLGFLFFHHSVSLMAGLPGSIYLADNSQFQWLGVLLAGGPVAFLPVDIFVKCAPKTYRKLHMASGLLLSCMFAFQRIVLFLPMAWNVTQAVHAATMPFWAKVCLYVGGGNMTLFNFICVFMCFHGWAQKFVLPKRVQAAEADTVDSFTDQQKLDKADTQNMSQPTLLTSSHARQQNYAGLRQTAMREKKARTDLE